MIGREELIRKAREAEASTYLAGWRGPDGTPYEADQGFLDLAFEVLGRAVLREGDTENAAYKRGVQFIEAEVIKRKQAGERKADALCGNWLMWTIFNLLEVSRVKK